MTIEPFIISAAIIRPSAENAKPPAAPSNTLASRLARKSQTKILRSYDQASWLPSCEKELVLATSGVSLGSGMSTRFPVVASQVLVELAYGTTNRPSGENLAVPVDDLPLYIDAVPSSVTWSFRLFRSTIFSGPASGGLTRTWVSCRFANTRGTESLTLSLFVTGAE